MTGVNFDIHVKLFTIKACSSYTFLTIILTNIFVSTKIQTLSYKCCRPFRSANYNTQHIHRTTNMVATIHTYKTVYTRQISKSSDFWLYVRSDTLYRKTRITNAFLQSIRFFPWRCYKPHFCEIYTSSVEIINRSYKIIDLTYFKTQSARTINQTLLKSIVHKTCVKGRMIAGKQFNKNNLRVLHTGEWACTSHL